MAVWQKESNLEDMLVEHLVSIGYEYRKDIKFMTQFKDNLFDKLEKLNNIIFTENEKRILNRDIFDKVDISILDCAKLWDDTHPVIRDSGETVRIKFIDLKEINNNSFQVINQLTVPTRSGASEYENRYDVMILINGLPMVAIELKKTGKQYKEGSALKEAFHQICRYRRDSYRGVLNFIRMFVISDKIETKYFSNNGKQFNIVTGEEEGLSWSFTTYWTDGDNNRISNLFDFSTDLLNKRRLLMMLSRHCVVTEDTMLLLRPYQCYAFERAIEKVTQDDKNSRKCYIWASTGSGKTLVCFQIGQELSKKGKTVLFIVDRRDLNAQTAIEFAKFSGDDSFLDDMTTSKLVKKIRNGDNFIVATIQKLNRLLNSDRRNTIDKLASKDIVMIFDECHRTVFGEMFATLQRELKDAAIIGVTGTPIFRVNNNNERVTADLFGENIHKYLMLNAQNDGTILPFDVTYYSVPDDEEKRVEVVTKDILSKYSTLTRNGNYNALFATKSKEMLINYYDKFKELNKDGLKITAIFTSGDEVDGTTEDTEETKNEALEYIIKDYNTMFGENYTIGSRNEFYTSVQKKLRNKELDLVIVVDMLLTGFDSKLLNTLFVDKNLKYHRAVQAFSRVNRVADVGKVYGNVVCYTPIQEEVREALTLYNSTTDISKLMAKPYKERLEDYILQVKDLLLFTPKADDVKDLMGKNAQLAFIEYFKAVVKAYSLVCVYPEFDVDKVIDNFNYQDYMDYTAAFYALKDKVLGEGSKSIDAGSEAGDTTSSETEITAADFDLRLVGSERIDTQYIINLLIKAFNKDSKKRTEEEFERIKSIILASGLKDVERQPLLDTLNNFKSTDSKVSEDVIKEHTKSQRDLYVEKEILRFSAEKNIEKDELSKWYNYYKRTGIIGVSDINKYIAEHFILQIIENKDFREKLYDSIVDLLHNLE